MIGSQEITIRFRVNWLITVAVVAVVLIGAFVLVADNWRPQLIFAVSVLAGSAALIAAINALDSRYAQLRQAKATAALEYVHRWTEPHFFHAKKSGRETLQAIKGKASEEQHSYLDQDPMRLANLIEVLNFFESMGIAIDTGIAEEEVAKRFFRSILLEYWNGAETFIKKRRAERNNARLSQETERLYERWKA